MCPVRVFFYFSYTGILLFPFRGLFCLYVLVLWQIHVCRWYILLTISFCKEISPFSISPLLLQSFLFCSFHKFLTFYFILLPILCNQGHLNDYLLDWGYPLDPCLLPSGCATEAMIPFFSESINRGYSSNRQILHQWVDFCLTDDIIVCGSHRWLRTLTFSLPHQPVWHLLISLCHTTKVCCSFSVSRIISSLFGRHPGVFARSYVFSEPPWPTHNKQLSLSWHWDSVW